MPTPIDIQNELDKYKQQLPDNLYINLSNVLRNSHKTEIIPYNNNNDVQKLVSCSLIIGFILGFLTRR